MILVGYSTDLTGQATWKYQILDETVSGRYLVIPLNHQYLGLMLKNKDELKDIHEEEEEEQCHI